MARRNYVELERDARRGRLTYRTVTLYRNKDWVTDDEARELNRLIAEHERQVAAAAPVPPAVAPPPVIVPGLQIYTFEALAEEIRSNRVNDGEAVDLAWRYAVGVRDACGRWPRDERKVTADLDPFALRVLRFIFNRRFDNLGVAEGVRFLGLCSYADIRRVAEQGAHEKRLRTLSGNFDYGVLKAADAADASRKGLGIPVTILGGEVLTGLLVQHYNRRAFTVASFDELESALTSPAGQGGLDLAAVQKAKESGKLLQVSSPEEWERIREEQRLQDLLGPEYWYLNSETGPEKGTFALLVDRHRMVLEDGTRDPRPILRIIAERISGDSVTVTEDDLWPYFFDDPNERPDPDAEDPQRAQSVFFSEKLAAHFAGRLEVPVKVVERFFTRHHDLAEEILARQGALRGMLRGAALFDVAIGPATSLLGDVIGAVAGAVVGAIPAIIFRSGILLLVGLLTGGFFGWRWGKRLRRLSLRGRRLGVVGAMLLMIAVALFACSLLGAISGGQNRRAALEIFRRQKELGITIPKAAEEVISQPSRWERVETFFLDKFAFVQENRWMALAGTLAGVVMVVAGGFALVFLIVGRIKGWI